MAESHVVSHIPEELTLGTLRRLGEGIGKVVYASEHWVVSRERTPLEMVALIVLWKALRKLERLLPGAWGKTLRDRPSRQIRFLRVLVQGAIVVVPRALWFSSHIRDVLRLYHRRSVRGRETGANSFGRIRTDSGAHRVPPGARSHWRLARMADGLRGQRTGGFDAPSEDDAAGGGGSFRGAGSVARTPARDAPGGMAAGTVFAGRTSEKLRHHWRAHCPFGHGRADEPLGGSGKAVGGGRVQPTEPHVRLGLGELLEEHAEIARRFDQRWKDTINTEVVRECWPRAAS